MTAPDSDSARAGRRKMTRAAFGPVIAILLGIALSAQGQPWEGFDHFRTRFPLVGAHERITCESCHRGGVFAGTPIRCALCHDGSGFRAQTSKDPDHLRTTEDCDDCHLVGAWVPSRFDHGAVLGSCFACHNGVDAEGKHPGHIVSSNDCEQCHRTGRWTGARFDHSGITAPCVSCHDNMAQQGKPLDHIQSSDDCELCHNTRRWEDAQFDHSNITEPCVACHQKDPGHIQSPNDCELCHNTLSWDDAQFDHSNVMSDCAVCHASDTPSGHFMTSEDCGECHLNTSWRPSSFRHSSPGYPGDHGRNLDCTDCHTMNNAIVVWPNPEFQPDCAACHASDFARRRHTNRQTGMPYTASELRDCTIACHVEDDGRPEHRVSAREW